MSPTAAAVLLAVAFVVTLRPRPTGRSTTAAVETAVADADPDAPRAVPSPRRRHPRRRRASDDPAEIARWCEALARAVRGGESLRGALTTVAAPADCAAVVAVVLARHDRPAVNDAPSDDRPVASSHLALAVAVISACLEHGGAAAEPLDRAADVLRARAAERDERRVQSAQARLSAQVMTLLPIVMLAVLVASSRSVRAVVVTTPGATVLAIGTALNLAGWRWMRRVIGDAAR